MSKKRRYQRHPAEVTSDRLAEHYEKWYDDMDGVLRDQVAAVRDWLERMAEKHRSVR